MKPGFRAPIVTFAGRWKPPVRRSLIAVFVVVAFSALWLAVTQ